jgi:hypothetical protein
VIGRQWLGVRYVEAGDGEVAAAESRNEIVGHDAAAAGNIDKMRTALHPREQPRIEHAYGIRRLGCRQDHEIGFAQSQRKASTRNLGFLQCFP